jgi:N-acetylmuramoyl-L-alanine amidase
MATESLPLGVGSAGEAVADLQRRLTAAGFPIDDPAGRYGSATEAAVRRFQQTRGLMVDGVCGRDTFVTLVEAGHQLGDRLIYHRSPMTRGEDVGELQRKLGALGFDSGRVDAIFGPLTERALKDFQRNVGLTTDGVCGPDVLAALDRLGAMTAGPVQVANIRERELLERIPRSLADRRIVIGDLGGMSVPALGVARALREAGAVTTVVDHPDRSIQANQANAFDAELYIGLCISANGEARAAYYATNGFLSVGGQHLAGLVADAVCQPFPEDPMTAHGMRLPVLRETRMPAVVCHLPRADLVVARYPQLAEALTAAISRWVTQPVGT